MLGCVVSGRVSAAVRSLCRQVPGGSPWWREESKLRNLPYGDRDSVGLFQQRPSQGWGTPAQISDPVYAVGRFFDALVKVPHYLNLPVTEAAQKVQRSGYPQAYARHQAMATTLADVLTGRAGPALSCTLSAADPTASAAQNGTADAVRVDSVDAGDAVAAAVRREFGRAPAAVAATGGADVSYPIAAGRAATGWSLALWLVCHATTLHATSVTFDSRHWSRTASDQGWTHTASWAGAASESGSGHTLTVTLGKRT